MHKVGRNENVLMTLMTFDSNPVFTVFSVIVHELDTMSAKLFETFADEDQVVR